MTLHIIHLPHRIDRLKLLLKELEQENITDYKIWNGVIDKKSSQNGIAKAHKQIVQYARDNRQKEILIGEDDLRFTACGAFEYFMINKPESYDLYLGGISHGKLEKDNTVKDFAGLLMYMAQEHFYKSFLSIPENHHIDRGLRNKGKYIVCDPQPVISHSGYSNNTNEYFDADIYFAARRLFGR